MHIMERDLPYDPVAIWKLAQARRRQALKLRAEGKTLQEIGEIMGVTHQRVAQIIKKALRHKAQSSG